MKTNRRWAARAWLAALWGIGTVYPGGWNQEILREKENFEQKCGGKLFEEGEALEDAWLSDRLLGDANGRVLTGTVFGAAQDGARCTGFYAATDRAFSK